jgi:NitT/TauT family transport system ATP-binding protein
MIKVTNLSKCFNNSTIISDFSFDFNEESIYCILGPSGCGKTTLLNVLSSIYYSDSGSIELKINANIGFMFQEDLLQPWRTLRENVELGLDVLNKTSAATDRYIEDFDLKGYEDYYPDELSGGMKQRAALIRTLITEPDILLLDEPFAGLDFDIKLRIQKIILDYQKRTKCLIILVTHDIEDAIALSDEIIILTEKPTTIKKVLKIDSGLREKDPIEVRKSPQFSNYFKEIWNELKYNGKNEVSKRN